MKSTSQLWPKCKALHLMEFEDSSPPIEHHPYPEAWWWQHRSMEMFFSGRSWETCEDRGNDEWSQAEANPWGEPASECKRCWTAVKIYVPTGQWSQAYSQSNTGMASEQQHERPWVIQPKPRPESHWESVERLDDCCSSTLLIQLDRAWANLQRRIGENLQIQMCKADADIPKKTRSCNHCQRRFHKVLTQGVEYLLMQNISTFHFSLICVQHGTARLSGSCPSPASGEVQAPD